MAQNKRYWAELSRDLGDGEVVRGQHLVFAQLRQENRAASSAGTVAGASVGWTDIFGHRSAGLLAGG